MSKTEIIKNQKEIEAVKNIIERLRDGERYVDAVDEAIFALEDYLNLLEDSQ